MEAQRSTDDIQQKASDCLGTVNEKPYDIGKKIIDMNESFALIRGAFSMIEALQALSKKLDSDVPKFESGGISINGIFFDESEFIFNDNPKKD